MCLLKPMNDASDALSLNKNKLKTQKIFNKNITFAYSSGVSIRERTAPDAIPPRITLT